MSGRRRALGQHFLVDASFVRRTIELAELEPGAHVLEIGPGRGALTLALLGAGHRVTAVERDADLGERLISLQRPDLHVEISDFLRFDLSALPATMPVVANLPYSVATAILAHLLASPARFPRIVVMLQQEVARRLAAAPGSRAYGSLSILTQMQAKVTMGFGVPAAAFRPPPRVESAVVRLDVSARPRFPVEDPARFRAVVRAAFAQRRKTLRNALGAAFGRDEAVDALAAVNVDGGRRAETVSIEEFVELAGAFGLDA